MINDDKPILYFSTPFLGLVVYILDLILLDYLSNVILVINFKLFFPPQSVYSIFPL